jgi:hypothetical protein
MVGADLEGFIASHDEPDFVRLLVGEQADVTRTTLFPFFRRCFESEQFGTPERTGIRE